MSIYLCDLHIHSCLSPCGDDDMTPGNIVGMAHINNLQIVALTDHNSVKNCPSFFKFADEYGITPIPGMEITTNEDIHAICLFRDLESAMDFGSLVDNKRFKMKNDVNIFGHQYLIDENDQIYSEEEHLLINASGLSLDDVYDEVINRNGVCYPAHIDKSSNGIISMLGTFPPTPHFSAFELNKLSSLYDMQSEFPILSERNLIHVASSDAHYLNEISENGFPVSVPDELKSSNEIRNYLIDYLLGKKL